MPSQKGYPCTGIIKAVDDLAKERNTSRTTIVIAWLLKHPTKIIPIIGSTNPERIRAAAAGAEIELTREEWYRLLVAARGQPLP